jgi:tRNA(fMet)-specific endonuclease VapC
MISHLLDTDTLTLFQHGHPNVTARCAAAQPGTLGITIITVEEQFLGWYTSAHKAKHDADVASSYDRMTGFATFIKQLPIVSFSAAAIRRYRQLKSLKLNVPKKDLCIAAIAREIGAKVVTCNAADFGRVPGLDIEDWSK